MSLRSLSLGLVPTTLWLGSAGQGLHEAVQVVLRLVLLLVPELAQALQHGAGRLLALTGGGGKGLRLGLLGASGRALLAMTINNNNGVILSKREGESVS